MKWARKRSRPLPLRLWLVLAVAAITGTGFLAQFALTVPVSIFEQQAEDARTANVRQILGTDATHWRDPAWQRHATASFASLGVDVALFPAQSNQPLYTTSGARRFVASNSDSGVASDDASSQIIFNRLDIAKPATDSSQTSVGVAFVWADSVAPGQLLGIIWAAVELGAFALTLAIVVWLIGQPVIRPLIALSNAAESIAGGNLNVRLPGSPVYEIAEVSAALEGMRSTLQQSLARQESLENERRFFIGAVAHDLRTPLFMLRGYLQGLQRGIAASPEKVARYLELCLARAADLDKLIADLFAFTRLEYLELEPERQPLDLGTLLGEVVEGAQPLAASKDISLTSEGLSTPTWVSGDSHLLARAVENLIDNAVRYTPTDGAIHVCWRMEGATVAFSVADSGPGIVAHDLEHLFEPLYRGEESRSRQTGGAGIGLAIASRILAAHGGTLTAANANAGGAVFTGTIPAHSEE